MSETNDAGGRADPTGEPGTSGEASGSAAPEPTGDREPASGAPGEAGGERAHEHSDEHVRDQRELRLAKIQAMRVSGIEPYPVRFDFTATAGGLRAEYGDLEPGTTTEAKVRIAGRVLLLRRQGKLSFATLQDRDGHVQLFVSQKVIGEAGHDEFDHLDRGD